MPSTFGWVDFLAEDRQKMLDVVHLFREQDTRDELGLGTIRDAFSDHFFPGTSTVQTRVRYMLFVPWMYQRLEEKRTPSDEVARKARWSETWLINELLQSESEDGVIGSEAGGTLKRLPSSIYWSGLGAWGIRLFEGSQEEYHRSLDAYYRHQSSSLYAGEADEELRDGGRRPNWHPGLPKRPAYFPEGATLALTREEAVYLRDRILTLHGDTLLAALVRRKKKYKAEFPWELPIVPELAERLQQDLTHAQNFSEVMHGASLYYNLLLSRMRGREAWISKYENRMARWSGGVSAIRGELKTWQRDMGAFWGSPALEHARIPLPTRRFVETWAAYAIDAPGPRKVADHKPAETLLRDRERALKRSRARLEHPRPLELWQGASGTNQYNYRWPVASSFVEDILKGLREGQTHA